MIEIMSIVAIIVGAVFSFWCFGRQAPSWLFVILHSSAFKTELAFYDLYDTKDDEMTFRLYRHHNHDVQKYADYLKIHADARPTAYRNFRSTIGALSKSLFLKLTPLALAPAILFWANWYLYLSGVAMTVICLVAYEIVRNGFQPTAYHRIIVFNSLNTYCKNKSE